MEFLKNLDVEALYDSFVEKATSLDLLIQLAAIILALVVGWGISRITARRIENYRERYFKKTFTLTIFDSLQRVAVPAIACVFLISFNIIAAFIKQPAQISTIVVSLLAAWVAIRFITSFAKYKVLARWFAFLAWGIVALNILGYFDYAVEQLDSIAFKVGENSSISVLVIIQGIVSLSFFLWLAIAVSRFLENHLMDSGLTPSLRVLFAKILRTTLVVIAILVSLNSFGIDLTAFAVFTGALGVGLGFGLQKIVSNFISGIILLMDRSIKPGDVISVDDTYGWVNKLSSRYVSVITRDNKEHLIPNELLITEKVENWSYSDKNVRLRIPFGVSYNSDMHEVRRLVLEAVGDLPRILKKPKPVCLMTGFGDSSVDFELRVWIDTPAYGVRNMMSVVYFAIWDAFKANNIEIPYPQRDVYIKEQPANKKPEQKAVVKKSTANKKK